MQIQSFINSGYQKSSNSFEKKNPFNLEPLHVVESSDMLQVVQAIQGAQKAFGEWKRTTLEERIQLINQISEALHSKKEDYAKLEALDQGLPYDFTLKHNIGASLECFRRSAQELSEAQTQEGVMFSPVGTIAIIASWNLSLRVISERLAPALAAGNAILVKVSSYSPVTAFILSEVLTAAQVPVGLVQVLVSNQKETKDLLVTHPSIKAVSFVGQLTHASEILKKTSQLSLNQFKKMQIATGSKNTAACLGSPEEVDFKAVMDSFMIGQGQLSWNSNRLFILEKHEDQWVGKIQNYLSEIKPAQDINDSSSWGPCIRPESFSHFAEIEKQAQADQARLIEAKVELTETQKKAFLRPAFTKDMSNCSTLQQDQVMAPLFILSVVKYPFDIAKYSNVSYYGLAAHIWADESKIEKVAESLDVANIYKNKWSVEVYKPQVGVKQSGFGIQDYRVFGEFYSNVKIMT